MKNKIFTTTLLFSLSAVPLLSHAAENLLYNGSNPGLLRTAFNSPPGSPFNSLAPVDLNSVDGNTITIDYVPNSTPGNTITGDAYGAININSGSTPVTGNTLTLLNGTVGGNLFGGFSTANGDVINNTVNIRGGTVGTPSIPSIIAGGLSTNGNASNNTINISGGTFSGAAFIAGGGTGTNGNATNNTVNISGGIFSAPTFVFGGLTVNGNATNNTVNFSNGTVEDIRGGDSSTNGDTTNNIVNISSGTISGNTYGGFSEGSGNATNNIVNISGGILGATVFGGNSNNGDATGNTINFSGGTIGTGVNGGLIGGSSPTSGNAINNTVNMSDGTVNGDVIGGSSNSNAIGNTVNISGGTINLIVLSSIQGGTSQNGDATGNTVNISGGMLNSPIAGGSSFNSNTIGNTVNISGGMIQDTVYGGVGGGFNGGGNSQNVINNTVNLSGGTLNNDIIGGYGLFDSNISGNTLNISGGTISSGEVFGALTIAANVTGNTVNISGGTINNHIAGASTSGGDATGNTVNISGGNLNPLQVYGGFSFAGNAIGNTVSLLGGALTNTIIYGGFSGNGNSSFPVNASGNTVNLIGGVLTDSTVYAGFSGNGDIGSPPNFAGNATGNTVNLIGGVLTGTMIYGGVSETGGIGGIASNNTLNVLGFQGSVGGLAGFDHYNFLLPASLGNGGTQLTVGSPVNLSAQPTQIAITGIQSGGSALQVGDTITLISSTTGAPTSFSGSNVHKGISLIYNFARVPSTTELIAQVIGAEVNPQLKSLSEGRLASLAFVEQGADQLIDASRLLAADHSGSGLIPFGNISGGSSRYDTGSHVDVNGITLLGGLAYPFHLGNSSWVLGAFAEAGWGNYSSNNVFINAAPVAGSGNTHYYGGGILSRHDFAHGIYLDGAARAGRVSTDFSTQDLCDPMGAGCASYSTSATYYGAQVGLGDVLKLNQQWDLDASTRYLWTHQNSSAATVVNDPINFAAINSQRWRNGVRLNYRPNATVSPYVGAAFEYEFSGQANATTYLIYNVDTPTLRGGTGIGELGVNVLHTTGRKGVMKLDVGAQGYVGRRQGVDGVLSFSYAL